MSSNLQLPGPRIWGPVRLARFVGFSIHWVYKRTRAGAFDPPPRCPGLNRLRFDTESEEFREWLQRQIGHPSPIDGDDDDEV